jgi:beta-phosphoglucomutase-like phosphatase (HAD superfamily)
MAHSYAAICFDLFGTLVDDDARPVLGAPEALALLPSNRVAIVTSAPRGAALRILARAGLSAPAVVVTADDVARGKPSPEPYVLAATRLAIDPSQALVVEDSVSGVEAAQAAGMEVAFVLRGRLSTACVQADYYLRTLADLAEFIRSGR